MSGNYYNDNEDLRFYIERAFEWSEIVALYERGFTDKEGFRDEEEALEFYRDILDNVGKFFASEVAPQAMANDKIGPSMVDGEVTVPEELEEIFEGFSEMGLYALNIPRELGGFNAPMVLYFAISEMLSRADISLVGHYGFHGGIAMSLLFYSLTEGSFEHNKGVLLKTRFDDAIAEIAAGENFGCMVLTEADAGSDLAALRAKAVEQPDGTWRLSGQKIFITAGHGQYQLVIAKTEDTGNGLKDISLFMVPRQIENEEGELTDNVVVERLEEKLGIHASVTCTLAYDDSVAELVGERGQGFKLMLMLMNNARLGVSFEGIGLIESAYRMAKEYAAERKSMGKTIDQHEMIADYLEKMDTSLRGLRALAFDAVRAVELSSRLEVQLKLDPPADKTERKAMERRMKKYQRRARDLTPLLKYLSSEKAVELSQLSMQIHGGVGYTKEFEIEKLVRDALVLPIYEGTSQIQSLMALKDSMGSLMKDPGRFLRKLAAARVASISARDPLDRHIGKLNSMVYGAMQHIVTKITKGKLQQVSKRKFTEWSSAIKDWDPKQDFAFGMLHAERLCRMMAEVEICKVLVAQARRFPERMELAEIYLERATPEVTYLHDQIMTTGDRLLKKLAEQGAVEG